MIPVYDWWRVAISPGCVSIGWRGRRGNWFYILRGEQTLSGGSSDKWEERTKTGNSGSQSDVPLFTMPHKNNGWCPGTPDGDHRNTYFFQPLYYGLYFCPAREFYLKDPHLSVAPLCGFVVVIFLWWLIRPAPPSLHTSLFALVNARARFPQLSRIPQFTKCLPISTSSRVPSLLPNNYCCRKAPLLHQGSHNNCQ